MRKIVFLGCLFGAANLSTFAAHAQTGEPEALSSPTDSPRDPAPDADAAQDEASKDPMGWIGIGVKVGYAFVGSSDIDVSASTLGLAPTVGDMQVDYTKTFSTPRRSGLLVSIPINLGGDGFGWIVEPYFHLASYKATGLYTGPTINLHLADPLYLGFGFGFKGALLRANELDFGIDLGGRVPFTLHYYLANDLGLIAEAGIGYTATGLSLKPVAGTEAGGTSFGGAVSWDFALGLRFP